MNLKEFPMPEDVGSKYISQDGWYNCRIVDTEQFISKAGGDGFKFVMEHEATGKVFTSIHMFNNEIAMGKLQQIATACGLSDEQMVNFTPMFLMGRKCLVHLKKNKKNPKFMNLWEVAEYNPGQEPGDAAGAAVTGEPPF